ncbi:Folylpolyglutamate synthase [Lecanosticta acicola]|uniref:tetrahydrofolate synthase n=1 Tax=Lecanosticta acicola TaxID=111012 RepID=A0AAI8Z735_9PEZI|nr:Folylpolyglutamate synthase [Lecanosticta acicola]
MAIMSSRRRRSRPCKSGGNASTNRGTPNRTDNVNALNVIHVAGTKGKGSTCSFTESFLRAHSARTSCPTKTGLYTSPHLIDPEERIRINSKPLSKASLAKYFFEIYDRLPQLLTEFDPSQAPVQRGPRYLQLWALLAFHVFIREGVDAAVIETHAGGEYDATNFVTRPVVAAVTTLGMDHIDMLGPGLDDIAWHKAGIYKAGTAALTTTQASSALRVLQQRARRIGEHLRVVEEDSRLNLDLPQLAIPVQRMNASLAAAATEEYLSRTASTRPVRLSAEDVLVGVQQWNWPGRFQILPQGRQTWFLDAAHNDMSVALAAQWFQQSSLALSPTAQDVMRVLIFSHINELRDADMLLDSLVRALKACNADIHHAIFTTYTPSRTTCVRKSPKPNDFERIWARSMPDSQVSLTSTIEEAIGIARVLSKGTDNTHTLVTGSQSLVGPALNMLRKATMDK